MPPLIDLVASWCDDSSAGSKPTAIRDSEHESRSDRTMGLAAPVIVSCRVGRRNAVVQAAAAPLQWDARTSIHTGAISDANISPVDTADTLSPSGEGLIYAALSGACRLPAMPNQHHVRSTGDGLVVIRRVHRKRALGADRRDPQIWMSQI